MGELQYDVEMVLKGATFSICAISGDKVQGVIDQSRIVGTEQIFESQNTSKL